MQEWYIAVMLVCGLGGECVLTQDKMGQVSSIEQCRSNSDAMFKRLQADPADIVAKIGKIDLTQPHRSFCLNPEYDIQGQIDYFYER